MEYRNNTFRKKAMGIAAVITVAIITIGVTEWLQKKPGPQQADPRNHVIYTLSITFQNGDMGTTYTSDPSVRWCPDRDCLCFDDGMVCGVRTFHYINPAPVVK